MNPAASLIGKRRTRRLADAITPVRTASGTPPAPASDRAPDWVADGTPEPLRSELEALLGAEQVLSRASDLVRYASDASPYRLFPKVVVRPRSEIDVARLAAYARGHDIPLVFRAGGTSLNGQGQGDGILVDTRHNWRGVEVLEDGAAARVRPGTILGHVNRLLVKHGRKLGPDPASTDIATMGGVLANNSGGMRCGTTKDTYSTLRSLRFVLPSGTTIDTAEPGAAERFAEAEPELVAGLIEIRDEIRGDGDLRERIERKFRIKNTMGYRLCAFLDAEEPLEIFKLLLVGSEGTLAFVSEVTLETVPLPRVTTTAWVHFPDIETATAPVGELVAAGATAVELMVAPALLVAAHSIPGTPEYWKELDYTTAALLVEFGADDAAGLAELQAKGDAVLAGHERIRPQEWQTDLAQIELAWRVREGLHGLIGKIRPAGTALIVEDVCVPPERIAECAVELQGLLGEHGFLTGVAGHTSAGNLHFMLTPDFAKPEDLERYDAFMAKLVEMIVRKYDGSLKAEHGTGVNMAPFLELEWGERATELMWRIKGLADPGGVLAPGVILNRSSDAHLANLKTTPEIEESVTACVDCGFCEPVCPSRDLTTTPRQRIALRREMARQPEGSPVLEVLSGEFIYDGLDTCAADGSCALTCPLSIDTGALVKELRGRAHGPRASRAAEAVADRWALVEKAGRAGLRGGEDSSDRLGAGKLTRASLRARQLADPELVPAWIEPMPAAAVPELPPTSRLDAAAVYMPACINRIFAAPGIGEDDGAPGDGGAERLPTLPAALVAVSQRAGMPVWIPEDVAGSCCGTPQGSKGFASAQARKANETVARLWRWSAEGKLPVVIDATSCTNGLIEAPEVLSDENKERHAKLEIVDSIEWARRLVASEALDVTEPLGSLTVHPTCASRKLGLDGPLHEVASAIATEVRVPPSASCCGFAGDRGFLHPELTASALAPEAAEVAAEPSDAYACANRTCEIGLRRETGRDYASIIHLLEERTRP